MEADAIIRERTNGKKSLDDFCRKFLGGSPTTAKVVPYELAEIVKDLQELTDFDMGVVLVEAGRRSRSTSCRSRWSAAAATRFNTRPGFPASR